MGYKKRYIVSAVFIIGIFITSLIEQHPESTIYALIPPVTAIVMAWSLRKVLIGMLIGVYSGALLLEKVHPLTAVKDTIWNLIIQSAIEKESLEIFGFTLLLSAMVGIMIRSGAVAALVRRISFIARGRRSGQLLVELLGVLIFLMITQIQW